MTRIVAVATLMSAMAGLAICGGVGAPEIDASSGAAAIGLIAGGLLILRSRKRRKN